MKKVLFSFNPYIAGAREQTEEFEYSKDTTVEEINEDLIDWIRNFADFGVTEIE